MRILVVGCGSIGRRHIRLLREMGVDVRGFDINPDARKQMAQNGTTIYDNMADAWDYDPDGVIIATPNHVHVASVEESLLHCKQRGNRTMRAILIEKPLACDVAAATALRQALDMNGCIQVAALVGYCLRFHPGLVRIKKLLEQGAIGTVRHSSIHLGSYLPGWRPGTDYRQNYAATHTQGGGVLLDASHELDYAQWLFGRPATVSCTMRNSRALEIETEDIADLIVGYASGVQANIHLDYLSHQYRRGCAIVGDKGTLEWYWKPPLTEIKFKGEYVMSCDVSPDDMYRAELRHFLECIKGNEKPLVTAQDGLEVLRLVEAAKQSAKEGRVVSLG